MVMLSTKKAELSVLVALASLLIAGCIIPYASDQTYGTLDPSQLDALVGKKKEAIKSKLGQPTYVLGDSYYIYAGFISTTLGFGYFDVVEAHDVARFETEGQTFCYLMVFDADHRMIRHDRKLGDLERCPEYFLSENELKELWRIQALRGDREAAYSLARRFGEQSYLMKLAQSGDSSAALALALRFDDQGPIELLANQGDEESEAALALMEYVLNQNASNSTPDSRYLTVAHEQYERRVGTNHPSEFFDAWAWLCLMASAGFSDAQIEVGDWHLESLWSNWRGWNEADLALLRGVGAQPDNRIAYMWYILADSDDVSEKRRSQQFRAGALSESEITQANSMVSRWRPGDCPSVGRGLIRR